MNAPPAVSDSGHVTRQAFARDLTGLLYLKAISAKGDAEGQIHFSVRLDWATEMTETEFFRKIEEMPKAKTHDFLDH